MDQVIQNGVIENSPPVRIVRLLASDADVARIDPVLGDRSRRALVVRTDFEAVVDIFADRRAAAQAKHQNRPKYPGR